MASVKYRAVLSVAFLRLFSGKDLGDIELSEGERKILSDCIDYLRELGVVCGLSAG